MQLLYVIRMDSVPSTSLAMFLILSTSLFLSHLIQAALVLPPNVTIPAVYVFGDSVVDTGNNNNLVSVMKCNSPPYGRDFMGGKATGRCSNGRVPSDMFASILGIKELLPPYLDPNLQDQDLLTGVNFASGASGYDPLTSKLASVYSITDQLGMFKEYIEKLKAAAAGEERAKSITTQSLYIVCLGSDDISNTYFNSPFRRMDYDVPAYTDLMLQSASSFLQELYGLGAKRIGVLSAAPIGCAPYQRTVAGGPNRDCAAPYNQAAQLFNQKLSSEIDSLNQKLPQARIVYVDIYYPLLDLIQHPRSYGFEESSKGCCGTGNLEVTTALCNELTPFTCTDVSKYVFWDSFHPTQKAYEILLNPLLQKYVHRFF
ncbi:PREDICTED: GDSL esterase/lipase EXL3-like [Nelumbo nucifera]|uniref:GDSL esterase/lipase EXL3-like n=2 Tax=Nelumbo nucifera TaxID=4432 RepID=A0A822ZTX5_NELNU|nr:PREDICTED: GDSL esterase/lipase EXL3-like [Nelumbo nucifera]DAD46749.1 TPA_asm: hypothetical protein HUJ06_016686 [Nelumbo nucifera]